MVFSRLKSFILIQLILISSAFAAEEVGNIRAKYESQIRTKIKFLTRVATQKKIVEEVRKSNERIKNIGKIKALKEMIDMDKQWVATLGVGGEISKFLEKDCSLELRKIISKAQWLAEILITNEMGALVCVNGKTSDYYQGDEKKWTNSYDAGRGKVVISKPIFDHSTQRFIVHVSIPIRDKGGKVIGVGIFGVDLDKIEVR